MTAPLAISADRLTKRYRVDERPPTSLGERIEGALDGLRGRPGRRRTIEALTDVSFSVAEGEALGVIGRNGSGKTTLLSLLSGVTAPDSGTATIHGRVGSLLAVGTGFHPELSGRDNVFLNGTLLGMRRKEIVRRFDEIVEFSGVGEFIDIPVKRYSSGMYVRLAFSIAAHLEPEVLLLDEVLSVGDRAFREKCHRRVAEITGAGRTVLFVSHELGSVQRMCARSLVLEKGRVAFLGPTEGAIAHYTEISSVLAAHEREGTGELRIARLDVQGADGRPWAASGGGLRIGLELETSAPVDGSGLELRIGIHAHRGMLVQLTTAIEPESPLARDLRSGTAVTCDVPALPLRPGEYWLSATLLRAGETIDVVEHRARFHVVPGDVYGTGVMPSETEPAPVVLPHRWHVAGPAAAAGVTAVPGGARAEGRT